MLALSYTRMTTSMATILLRLILRPCCHHWRTQGHLEPSPPKTQSGVFPQLKVATRGRHLRYGGRVSEAPVIFEPNSEK